MLQTFRQKKIWIPLLIIILAFAFFILRPTDKQSFTTEKAFLGNIEQIVSVNGTVETSARINLRFEVPGQIANILVTEGDQVTSSQDLVQLDNKSLSYDLDQSAAALQSAQAELNLALAGPPKEAIAVSDARIKEAQVIFDNAKQTLENRKLLNEQSLRQAELSLQQAELDYQNSLDETQTSSTISDQTLQDAYQNSNPEVKQSFNIIRQSLDTADSFMGRNRQADNVDYEKIYAALPLQTRVFTNNLFTLTSRNLPTYESTYSDYLQNWDGPEVEELIDNTLKALRDTKLIIDNIYLALKSTDLAVFSVSTQNQANTFKSTIESQQLTLTARINTLQTLSQSIKQSRLALTKTDISGSSITSGANTALEIAKSNLESVKVNNQIAENQSIMDLNLAKARLDQALANHQDLIAPPRDVDLATIRAQITRQNAIFRKSQNALQNSILKAPIAGVIANSYFNPGETVNINDIVIDMITDGYQIKTNISEIDIVKIAVGNPVTITLDAFALDQTFQGTVVSINPAETIIQGVIYYQATIVFDSPEENIRPGMTANLDIETAYKEQALLISPQAINYDNTRTYVYVLENGERVQKFITLGLESDQYVEVTSGLQESDEIILYAN